MAAKDQVIYKPSERKVLTALQDGKEHRWNELEKMHIVSKRALIAALKSLTEQGVVIRREAPGLRPHAVTYQIAHDRLQYVQEDLDFQPNFEWEDRLRPVVELIEASDFSQHDKSLKLWNLFNDYEMAEFSVIKRQIMWAGYCRLRGDTLLEKLLASAVKRNFAKYAEHILEAIHKDPLVAYAYVELMADEDDEIHDMVYDELNRVEICEEAMATYFNYDIKAKRALEWLPDWSNKVKREKEREFKFRFSMLTQPAEYLNRIDSNRIRFSISKRLKPKGKLTELDRRRSKID